MTDPDYEERVRDYYSGKTFAPDVVPRSVAEALAEALEEAAGCLLVDRLPRSRWKANVALAEYRAAYPKETP